MRGLGYSWGNSTPPSAAGRARAPPRPLPQGASDTPRALKLRRAAPVRCHAMPVAVAPSLPARHEASPGAPSLSSRATPFPCCQRSRLAPLHTPPGVFPLVSCDHRNWGSSPGKLGGWCGRRRRPSVVRAAGPQQQLVVACQVILATWRRRSRVRSTLVCSLLPHARGRLARAVAFSGRVTRSRPGLKAVTRAGLTRLVQMSALIFGSAPSGGD